MNVADAREGRKDTGLCEIVAETEVAEAFVCLRRGYPGCPLGEQAKGQEFRVAARIVTDTLVWRTLEEITEEEKGSFTVLMPWRAGLAFAPSYRERGIRNFYHVSARRNEQTLETIVDYEHGDIAGDSTVVIADPMLATGNTVIDALQRLERKGISADQVIVNAVIAAPEGIEKVHSVAPSVRIIVGGLDTCLDHRGYIVPGLGDFGDKYFHDFGAQDIDELLALLEATPEVTEKMQGRFQKHTEVRRDGR